MWAQRALIVTPDDYLVLYNVARTYSMLGDTSAALDRLEQAFAGQPALRRRLAAWMPLDHDLDALRGDPRFRALEQRLAQEFAAMV